MKAHRITLRIKRAMLIYRFIPGHLQESAEIFQAMNLLISFLSQANRLLPGYYIIFIMNNKRGIGSLQFTTIMNIN